MVKYNELIRRIDALEKRQKDLEDKLKSATKKKKPKF
jgi:hypothetical protein